MMMRLLGDSEMMRPTGTASKTARSRASLSRSARSAFLRSSISSTVPYQRMIFPGRVSSRSGTGTHPAPDSVTAADAKFDIDGMAACADIAPIRAGRDDIGRMQRLDPALIRAPVPVSIPWSSPNRGPASRILPFGVAGPGNLGIEFDGMAVVIFTLAQRLFGELAAGDIDDSNRDTDNLFGFVANRLIGSNQGKIAPLRSSFWGW